MDRWVEEQKGGQMRDREAAASGRCGQGYKQGQGPYWSSWRVTLGAGGMRACTDLFQVQGGKTAWGILRGEPDRPTSGVSPPTSGVSPPQLS